MYSFKKKIKSCTSINFSSLYLHVYREKRHMWGYVIIARMLPWKLMNLFRIRLTKLRVNIKIKHPCAFFFYTLHIKKAVRHHDLMWSMGKQVVFRCMLLYI